jgi:hypothetical protein
VGKDRYFDLDAVRDNTPRTSTPATSEPKSSAFRNEGASGFGADRTFHADGGAPPLDWWKISPKGYAGAHYAVWPSELCVKPIKAMSPERVCRKCGEPSRRITEWTPEYAEARSQIVKRDEVSGPGLGYDKRAGDIRIANEQIITGWTNCRHNDYRPGLVLDPFAGTGTTLAVAHGHGRDAIGIDIDERSAELAHNRVGPLFLDIVNA